MICHLRMLHHLWLHNFIHILSWKDVRFLTTAPERQTHFYQRDAMLARVLAVALCPCLSVCLSVCVCHKSVFCRNGWTNWAGFWHGSFFPPILHCMCYKEIHVSSKIGALPSGTLFQTLDLDNFTTACRSSKRVINFPRERWTLRAW